MIALFTDDPVQIISGILAVLRAGAVFVPLDPAFPDQRLQAMTERGVADLRITDRDFGAR